MEVLSSAARLVHGNKKRKPDEGKSSTDRQHPIPSHPNPTHPIDRA
jgi:hypothetical protein